MKNTKTIFIYEKGTVAPPERTKLEAEGIICVAVEPGKARPEVKYAVTGSAQH